MSTKTHSVRLTALLNRKVQKEAKRRGVTKTAIVKDALERYFGIITGPRKTFRELAGDLVGSVEGPGDLSYNPKYMEGFGE
jgi:hypothetical protein